LNLAQSQARAIFRLSYLGPIILRPVSFRGSDRITGTKVRDAIRLIEADDWYFVGQEGSHRQFKHAVKKGPGYDQRPSGRGYAQRHSQQWVEAGGLEAKEGELKYTVVIEKGEINYGAYVPDLPGCVAVGDTIEEVEERIRGAIDFHVRGLHEVGLEVPPATSIATEIEVNA
jgi:predicted RNase H-like HicB family nuclease